MASTGCGDKCHKFMNKAKECIPGLKDEKPGEADKDIKQCQDELLKNKEDTEATLACADKSTCADFMDCQKDVMKKHERKEVLATISSATKANDFDGKAMTSCEYGIDMFKGDKEVEDACGAYLDQAIAAKTTALIAKRDKGDDAGTECYMLRETAKKRGSDAKIEVLCNEISAAKDVKEAIAAAKKNMDGKTADMPFNCDYAIEQLEKIHSDWSKAQAIKVAQACYVDLGQIILEAKVPGMAYVCEYGVEKVYNGIKKFNLQNDKNKPLLAKADKLCEKK
jgi:hypothetical protein